MIETLSISDLSLLTIGLLVFTGFLAGYIDAIAGGGGMVQTLALLMAGLPATNILATNKFASVAGTTMAVIKFARGRVVPWRLVGICLLPCLIASAIGSSIVKMLPNTLINWLIIGCIPIALLVMLLQKPKAITDNASTQANEQISAGKAIASISPIAFYDGLVGPGTGTFMAIAGNRFLNLRFLNATGMAKPLNLATNIGSLIVFILSGKVIWALAIHMAIASMLGGYLGGHFAVKYGDGFIKKVIVIMLVVMLIFNLIKLLMPYFSS